ncbi:MAG: rhodanese-related sulfurtransferase [Cyanobium sp.]
MPAADRGHLSSLESTPVQVAAFYRFTAMAGLPPLRSELLQLASGLGVRGTILLAEEGVNGTISGPEAGVAAVLARLRQCPGLEPLEVRISWAPQSTFHRLKVRIKREIVTMGCPTVKPAERVGTYVPAEQWEALIRDPDTLLVDTRNSYEVAIGTFAGAIDPGTASFREFPAWVERELRPLVQQRRPKTIAMFCTGGIRCEKSTAYLLQQSFDQVVHLQGGILRYLEEHPEPGRSWRGECYVFDQRVSVNHRLEPGSYSLCHACGLPLSAAERQHPAFREGVSCPHCLDRFEAADRARFAERQRQIERARARGEAHVGAVMPGRPTGAEPSAAVAQGGEPADRVVAPPQG